MEHRKNKRKSTQRKRERNESTEVFVSYCTLDMKGRRTANPLKTNAKISREWKVKENNKNDKKEIQENKKETQEFETHDK